jgi:hypothetical protein
MSALRRRLVSLLRRRGYRITGSLRSCVADLVAVIEEEHPDGVGGGDGGDDAVEEQDDLARNHPITCPHCGEAIEVAIDLSAGDQDGIQDCTVCCSPIRITYQVDNGRMTMFSSEPG